MENVYYSSEQQHSVAPKFVIFKTAIFSLLFVATLVIVFEIVSFVYIEPASLASFLCFIWFGITSIGCGILGIVYIYHPKLNSKWLMAKTILGLSSATTIGIVACIIYRILLIPPLLKRNSPKDRIKLALLLCSFSLVLDLALLALSILISHVTLTMYKIRTIVDGEEKVSSSSNDFSTKDSMVIQNTQYQILNEDNV